MTTELRVFERVDGTYLSIQRSGKKLTPEVFVTDLRDRRVSNSVRRNPIIGGEARKLHIFERTKGPSRGVQEIAQIVARDCLAFSTELCRW
ncbi:uncharacterized protein Bfra_005463 [Botrytis fragariae]|uniref:Uncharacterized protein n=1 Tax=Botrytis fragariae TaxID=1964551 RepID=A0A8H6AUT6_9HELO|nr:uncharacterized protein Bfra_005463 [Botrytis fragariae]KAF5873996.1 hypothetical protein Bfra_005463 [Botrytis fragariae]